MAPPGLAATTSARCTTTTVTPETLIRDAHKLMQGAGISRSANWTTKVVRTYLRSPMRGLPFGQYLTRRLELSAPERARLYEPSALRYVLDYADPTGETAVRHVMAARR